MTDKERWSVDENRTAEEQRRLDARCDLEDGLEKCFSWDKSNRKKHMSELLRMVDESGLSKEDTIDVMSSYLAIALGSGMGVFSFDEVINDFREVGFAVDDAMIFNIANKAVEYANEYKGEHRVDSICEHFHISKNNNK